ncbi:MAG: ferredoxin family protein [bacterium]|nr:ferredoxin family protein [bacterium]
MAKNKNYQIFIDERLCKGCDICVELCGKDVFTVSEQINKKGYYVPLPTKIENCSGCMICELICPEIAVIVEEEEKIEETP